MKKIKILIPVYNDWKSVFKLLENIDLQIIEWDAEVSVLIVNDASTEERPTDTINLKNVKSVQIINMKENKGPSALLTLSAVITLSGFSLDLLKSKFNSSGRSSPSPSIGTT